MINMESMSPVQLAGVLAVGEKETYFMCGGVLV